MGYSTGYRQMIQDRIFMAMTRAVVGGGQTCKEMVDSVKSIVCHFFTGFQQCPDSSTRNSQPTG